MKLKKVNYLTEEKFTRLVNGEIEGKTYNPEQEQYLIPEKATLYKHELRCTSIFPTVSVVFSSPDPTPITNALEYLSARLPAPNNWPPSSDQLMLLGNAYAFTGDSGNGYGRLVTYVFYYGETGQDEVTIGGVSGITSGDWSTWTDYIKEID